MSFPAILRVEFGGFVTRVAAFENGANVEILKTVFWSGPCPWPFALDLGPGCPRDLINQILAGSLARKW